MNLNLNSVHAFPASNAKIFLGIRVELGYILYETNGVMDWKEILG